VTLAEWQLVSIIVSIIGSAVGAAAWVTWKMAKVKTEIHNLKDNLKKLMMILHTCSGYITRRHERLLRK
jgi:uncharacterized protein (DUF697 family)